MARKTKYVQIPDDPKNRDKGKCFLITEMSAWDAEKFALKAFSAMSDAGVDLTNEDASVQAIVQKGIGAFLKIKSDKMTELMSELMSCVRKVPNPVKEPQTTMPLMQDDGYIEEISTLIKLRYETIMLHLDFFLDGDIPSIAS